MLDKLTPVMLIGLRLFGGFWIVGGLLTFRAARQSLFIDHVLESLSQEPEDRLVSHFLLLSAILTFLTGLGLCLARRWSLIPLGVLVVSQPFYFHLKTERFEQAQTEEERENYRIQPSTRNAFWVSVVLFVCALGAERMGLLR